MKNKNAILVIESSKSHALEIVKLIGTLEDITEVFYTSAFDKSINLLQTGNVAMVICGIHFTRNEVAKLLELRSLRKSFSLVVLIDYPSEIDNQDFDHIGVEYFLQRNQINERLPAIIRNSEAFRYDLCKA